MARITWLGEDQNHDFTDSQGNLVEGAGPSFTRWQNIKFPKGEAVEVTDQTIVSKAKANKFFKVEGTPGRPRKPDSEKVEADGSNENAD